MTTSNIRARIAERLVDVDVDDTAALDAACTVLDRTRRLIAWTPLA